MSLNRLRLGERYEIWNGGRRSPRNQGSGFTRKEALEWAKGDKKRGYKMLVVKVSRTLVRVS